MTLATAAAAAASNFVPGGAAANTTIFAESSPGAAAEPRPLRGVPLTGVTGLRLLVANNPPFLLDVDTGRITHIRGLTVRGHAVLTVLAVGRDAIVRLERNPLANKIPRDEIYVVRRGSTRATRLATASEVAPAAGGSAVWLKAHEDARNCTLRKLALNGSERQSPRPVPCSTRLVDADGRALLIEGRSIIDPNTGETLLDAARLWAIAGEFAVTTERSLGPLTLTDLRSNQTWRLRYPSRVGGQGGTDEAAVGETGTIALSFSDPAYQLGGTQVTDVWLLDPAARRFRHLPDLPAVVSLKSTSMSWTSDGRLVMLAETDQRNVVAVWRPGQKRIRVRPVRIPARNSGSDAFVVW
ncbi:MAG: hypothetical protein MSC30_05905 [Gaiellaceae bacterium MAG52_C11]|nr:hypothetical protein [Candidatus Gaiellasilicea maunaloa]